MPRLPLEAGNELVEIARQALRAGLACAEAFRSKPRHAILEEPGGAFVTLRKHGQLRGCIGRLGTAGPLCEIVAECAVAAALRDPRFPPVTVQELGDLEIEVSVLGAFEKIEGPEQIEVGRHGILVKKGLSQGLLLPQVALEMNLDAVSFLELTCRKAGLPLDAWRSGAVIQVFTAEIFPSPVHYQ